MKFLNRFFWLALLLGAGMCLQSCSDDDDNRLIIDPVEGPDFSRGAFILCQGNYYAQISGSIGYLNYNTNVAEDSVFFRINGKLPGNTLQAGIFYGSHFLAIAYESNTLFVADRRTLQVQQEVKIDYPRAIVAEGPYVYISNYDGYVTRLDTLGFAVKDTIKVGPNPEEMAVANGYLYVVNSDGLNYKNGYSNGKSVSKVRLYIEMSTSNSSVRRMASFKVEKTIPVGLNPTRMQADSEGNVFLIAMGNYNDVPSKIQKINAADEVTDLECATAMTVVDNVLYAFYTETDPETYAVLGNTYFCLDTRTLERRDLGLGEGVDYPIAIQVDPKNKDIFVTSHNQGQWGADYNGAGYVKRYKNDGTYVATYATGVNPVQMLFTEN